MSLEGSEMGLTNLPEARRARGFLIELGRKKLEEISESILTARDEQPQHDYVYVRLRAIVETLLRGSSVTETDMMALAWYVKERWP